MRTITLVIALVLVSILGACSEKTRVVSSDKQSTTTQNEAVASQAFGGDDITPNDPDPGDPPTK